MWLSILSSLVLEAFHGFEEVAAQIPIFKAPLCKGGCQRSIAMLTGGL